MCVKHVAMLHRAGIKPIMNCMIFSVDHKRRKEPSGCLIGTLADEKTEEEET